MQAVLQWAAINATPPDSALIEGGNLDDKAEWKFCQATDCNPVPPTTHEFNQGWASPSLDGSSIETYETGAPYWGILYYYTHTFSALEQGAPNYLTAAHYRIEWSVYLENTSFQALEFDFPVIVDNHKFYFGSQCVNGQSWQYWNRNPADGVYHWQDLPVPCSQMTANTWHHIVWSAARAKSQDISTYTYTSLSIDGQNFPINITITAPQNNSGGIANNTITPQFQKDGNSSGASYHMYVDKVNAWAW